MKNRDSPISHGHEQQDNDLHEDDFDESLFSQQRRQKLFQGECSFPSNGQGVSVSATCGLRLLTTLSQMEMGKGSGKSSFSDLAGFTIKVVMRIWLKRILKNISFYRPNIFHLQFQPCQ